MRSGPIHRSGREGNSELDQRARQVRPIEIVFLDQIDLSVAPPLLEQVFPLAGRREVFVNFAIDEAIDLIFASEGFDATGSVLLDPSREIVRHADVERSVLTAGEDVNEILGVQSVRPGARATRAPGHTRRLDALHE